MKQIHILLILALSSTLSYAEDQPTTSPQQTPTNTVTSLVDTAKGIFSTLRTRGTSLFKRVWKETGYFGQEVRSFFRTEQQIILKQKAQDIAHQYQAVLLTITLEELTPEQAQALTALTNDKSLQLNKIIAELYQFIGELDEVSRSYDIAFQPHLTPPTPVRSSIIFCITHPKKRYEWVEMIQAYQTFFGSTSKRKDKNTELESCFSLIQDALTKDVLQDILIT